MPRSRSRRGGSDHRTSTVLPPSFPIPVFRKEPYSARMCGLSGLRLGALPEDARLHRHRRHEQAVRVQRRKRRPCRPRHEVWTESLRVRIDAPTSPPADDAEIVPPWLSGRIACDGRGRASATRVVAPARARVRPKPRMPVTTAPAGGSGRTHLPRHVAGWGSPVVTGRQVGLQAGGGRRIPPRRGSSSRLRGSPPDWADRGSPRCRDRPPAPPRCGCGPPARRDRRTRSRPPARVVADALDERL